MPGFTVDFTDLPVEDDTFDTVVFDPPYKLDGTGGSHPVMRLTELLIKAVGMGPYGLCIQGDRGVCQGPLRPGGHHLYS